MKAQYISLLQTLEALVADVTQRNKLLACTLGIALAARVDLPSGPITGVATYYATTVQPGFNALLSEFNENLIFDLKCAQECARAYWLTRYNAAHPGGYPLVPEGTNFFVAILGANMHFSDEMIAYLTEHGRAICLLGMEVDRVINDLKPTPVATQGV